MQPHCLHNPAHLFRQSPSQQSKMVLPLIPLALGAGALATAITGLMKGWDAKQNFTTASSLIKSSEQDWRRAADALELRRTEISDLLAQLADLRLSISSKSMGRFARLMDKIAKADIEQIEVDGRAKPVKAASMPEVKKASYEATEFLAHGLQSGLAGTLVGAGVSQAVGMFGLASTGAAISGLSGAAATNATLAWLGGGSLASGGLGMAGGTIVLGGVVAGPVLMVMGYLVAGKSEQALTQAAKHAAEMATAIEQLANFVLALDAIDARARELTAALRAIDKRFMSSANRVARLIGRVRRAREYRYVNAGKSVPTTLANKPIEFSKLSQAEQGLVITMVALGSTLFRINQVEIIDKEGRVTKKSEKAIAEVNQIVEAL